MNHLNPGILDRIMDAFNRVLSLAWAGLTPDALYLLSVLSALYLIAALFVVQAGFFDIVPEMGFRLARYLGFVWVITNLQSLTDTFVRVAVSVGLFVGGNQMTFTEFLSPGRILFQAQGLMFPLIDHVNHLSWLDYGKNFAAIQIMVVAMYLAWFCFLALTLHIVVVVCGFKLLAIWNMVLIPWGIFNGTAFIARQAIDKLISQLLALGTLALITGVIVPILLTLAFPPGQKPTYWSAFAMLTGAVVLAVFSWYGPRLAAAHGGALMGLMIGTGFAMMRAYGWARRQGR